MAQRESKLQAKTSFANSHSPLKLTILAFMFISKFDVVIQFIWDIQKNSLFQIRSLERKKLGTWLLLIMLCGVIQLAEISWMENSRISSTQCDVITSFVNIMAKDSAWRMTFLSCWLISDIQRKLNLALFPMYQSMSTQQQMKILISQTTSVIY